MLFLVDLRLFLIDFYHFILKFLFAIFSIYAKTFLPSKTASLSIYTKTFELYACSTVHHPSDFNSLSSSCSALSNVYHTVCQTSTIVFDINPTVLNATTAEAGIFEQHAIIVIRAGVISVDLVNSITICQFI